MSQPQKNSGSKRAAKESNVSKKNRNFISLFLGDVANEDADNIHIARVIKKFGNGRLQVFYVTYDAEDKPIAHIQQAKIKSSMRGRGKRSVWIDIGSIVIVAEMDLVGLEIEAVIDQAGLDQLKKTIKLDQRILAVDNTDEKSLMSTVAQEDGFEFEQEEKELDLDKL
jgi:hypothetical protein